MLILVKLFKTVCSVIVMISSIDFQQKMEDYEPEYDDEL